MMLDTFEDLHQCPGCRSVLLTPQCPSCTEALPDDEAPLESVLGYLSEVNAEQRRRSELTTTRNRLYALMRRLRVVTKRGEETKNQYDLAEASALRWALAELQKLHPGAYEAAARRLHKLDDP